jgi:glycosyltransferase involved in cell wall biosynthesis
MAEKKILLLEPYYGGSHRHFVDGLMACLPARFTLLSLPARKWKMRMQLAAPWFASQISDLAPRKQSFDLVLSSTFTDLAVFKALVVGLPGWQQSCRFLAYFHENQFHYPERLSETTNHQFAAINFTTALIADGLAFNSDFNRQTFLHHCRRYLRKAVDIDLSQELAVIEEKSEVLYPGIDFTEIDGLTAEGTPDTGPPLIIWNHRWEHDKNPEEFFSVLTFLQREGIAFRCAVLGQQFRDIPPCFEQARRELGGCCVQFGYLPERERYLETLIRGDIVVSTAHHEFFGLAVIEAVRAGCLPVLPKRLSYPELFAEDYLYPDGGLYEHLKTAITERRTLAVADGRAMTERFSWPVLDGRYRAWFEA